MRCGSRARLGDLVGGVPARREHGEEVTKREHATQLVSEAARIDRLRALRRSRACMEPLEPLSDLPARPPDLTLALRGLGGREGEVSDEMLAALVGELRAVARGYLAGQRPSHTLQPTALVNEAFLKLFGSRALGGIEDREHFFALAARTMRQVLVDHARRRAAGKRGGELARVTLADGAELRGASDAELLDVDQALLELAELDERQARIVELRFFAGLEMEETAAAMGLSLSTVEREWRGARAWLGRRIGDGRA